MYAYVVLVKHDSDNPGKKNCHQNDVMRIVICVFLGETDILTLYIHCIFNITYMANCLHIWCPIKCEICNVNDLHENWCCGVCLHSSSSSNSYGKTKHNVLANHIFVHRYRLLKRHYLGNNMMMMIFVGVMHQSMYVNILHVHTYVNPFRHAKGSKRLKFGDKWSHCLMNLFICFIYFG